MSSVELLDPVPGTACGEPFREDRGREEHRLPGIWEIPLAEIDDFPDHPYRIRMDGDMEQLVESVKARGIITPVTVRPKEDGRYEMVSGHRRKKACELAGLETVKAEVRELTRDEAILLMVESNLQRSEILPSEKAFAYRMHLEAMKRQGRRTDLTSDPVGGKLAGKESAEIVGDLAGDSSTQVRRFIRLTHLIPGLLDLVDAGRIALRPAVELSYLAEEEQENLLDAIACADATPSLSQASTLRALSGEGRLTEEWIGELLSEEKPNQREKIAIRADRLRRYLPPGISPRQAEEFILKALEYYCRYLERRREQER